MRTAHTTYPHLAETRSSVAVVMLESLNRQEAVIEAKLREMALRTTVRGDYPGDLVERAYLRSRLHETREMIQDFKSRAAR